MTPAKVRTGGGKTTSNQQAVGGLHYRRNQITGTRIRRLELKR